MAPDQSHSGPSNRNSKELVQLKTLVGSTGDSESESSVRRSTLTEEEAILKAAASKLGRLLDGLESSLLQLTNYFPGPLLEATKEARLRLQSSMRMKTL